MPSRRSFLSLAMLSPVAAVLPAIAPVVVPALNLKEFGKTMNFSGLHFNGTKLKFTDPSMKQYQMRYHNLKYLDLKNGELWALYGTVKKAQ